MLIRACKAAALAVVLVSAALVAVPRASAAGLPITAEISPYALLAQNTSGVLMDEESDYGLFSTGVTLAPGTSPSAAPIPGDYQFVWQGANGHLWTSGPTGPDDLATPMAPGTSPSLVTFPDGKWLAALHGADGTLRTNGSWGLLNMAYTLAPGTSPSVADTPVLDLDGIQVGDDYTLAWQGSNGHLWLWDPPTSPIDTGLAMAPGTSPSVTRLANTAEPEAQGNYFAVFQGSNGDLWTIDSATGASAIDTKLAMAPGTSPSVSLVTIGQGGYYPAAFQGSNGHLWLYDGVGDTGLAMMAGSSPSLMITPVDLPGQPLGDRAAYTGYASSTGVASVYGYNYVTETSIEQSIGGIVAAGTSPSIASALNWVDGGWVVGGPGAPATAGAAAAGAAAVPLKLPSKPAIKPDTAPVVMSGTCSTVRAHLKQYAARGIKDVACETTTLTPARTGTRAVTPSATGSGSCGNGQWAIDRTDECVQNSLVTWETIDVETRAITGYLTFLISQDIILSTSSDLFTENDSITYSSVIGPATGLPATVTYEAGCGSPCTLATASTFSFPLTLGASKSFSFAYQDNPAAGGADNFYLSYSFNLTVPGFLPEGGPDTWNAPDRVRCDNNTPGWSSPGCVVPTYAPTLVLPLSVYGAAAMNAYVGELYLPGTPGLSSTTPLTRGDPDDTDANRAVTCSGFTALAPGNSYGVVSDSCDEYPFASSEQSGGALGIPGSDCLEIVPYQSQNGQWTFNPRNRYTNAYPQVCVRGHVNGTLNSLVGSQVVNPLYVNNRMMIGDPYTVQVTQ